MLHRTTLRRGIVAACAAGTALAAAPGTAMGAADPYIVVLDRGADARSVAAEHARQHGAEVRHVYSHALDGYAARIPAARLDDVRRDARVAYVERDGTMRAVAQTIPWGISKVGATVSSTAAGNGSGTVTGVRAYVIDSGIHTTHSDLSVVGHVNFAGGTNSDCNGHGTHVAGTVAARDNTIDVVGVAPGAALVGVKVLGCSGSGSTSGVIAGVDWVTGNAVRPAIANMSLGGGASQALDDAVRRSASSGVLYSIAAGNSGVDACTQSPARAGAGTNNGIVTTAATDSADREASWSNYGRCVDIWAPGVSVLSTRNGGGTTTMSGTSMAAPHVGGGAALYLSRNTGASPTTVETALRSAAQVPGTVSKDGRTITRLWVGGF